MVGRFNTSFDASALTRVVNKTTENTELLKKYLREAPSEIENVRNYARNASAAFALPIDVRNVRGHWIGLDTEINGYLNRIEDAVDGFSEQVERYKNGIVVGLYSIGQILCLLVLVPGILSVLLIFQAYRIHSSSVDEMSLEGSSKLHISQIGAFGA